MASYEVLFAASALTCATVAACFDVKTRRIPNKLSVPCLMAGLLLHYFAQGWAGLGSSLAAAAIAFGIFLLFFLAGGMGGGDVKLIAAVGALAGLHMLPGILVATALIGGALAIGMVMMRGQMGVTLRNMASIAGHHAEHGLSPHPTLHVRNEATLRLPYGVAIAAGVLVGCWQVFAF
jgi:prepilin peptidase CpaA